MFGTKAVSRDGERYYSRDRRRSSDTLVTVTNPSLVINVATTAPEFDAARKMFLEYAASLRFSLEYQRFDSELDDLPAQYGLPTGALLLARVGDEVVGVVALRGSGAGVCEMKRLYVRPSARALRTEGGASLGTALAQKIIEQARSLGYTRMRLDTVAQDMEAATRLYHKLGFVEIEPYYPSPIAGTVFLELKL